MSQVDASASLYSVLLSSEGSYRELRERSSCLAFFCKAAQAQHRNRNMNVFFLWETCRVSGSILSASVHLTGVGQQELPSSRESLGAS